MQNSYECELATHNGPESCGAARKGSVEALPGERASHGLLLDEEGSCAGRGWPRPLGSHAAPYHPLAASACRLSSLSPASHRRPHLRQEPDAVVPLVRIRGGGYERS